MQAKDSLFTGTRTLSTSVLLGLVVILLSFGATSIVNAQDELPEVLKLRAEKFKLEAQVAQLQADVRIRDQRIQIYEIALGQSLNAQSAQDSARLTAEQSKLVETFRAALKEKPERVFNWESLKFEDPPKEDKK